MMYHHFRKRSKCIIEKYAKCFYSTDITTAIESEILRFKEDEDQNENLDSFGVVASHENGIVSCTGLRNAGINSIIKISDSNHSVFGYALALERNIVKVALLGKASSSNFSPLNATAELVHNKYFKLPVLEQSSSHLHSPCLIAGSETTMTNIPLVCSPTDFGPIKQSYATGILPVDTMLSFGFGERIAIQSGNINVLRRFVTRIIQNQKTLKQFDHCIYVSASHEYSGVSFESNNDSLPVTVIACNTFDSLPVRARTPCVAVELAKAYSDNSNKRVLVIFDDMGAIGESLAKLEANKTGYENIVRSPWAMVHAKYLEAIGPNVHEGGISAICLVHSDGSPVAQQFCETIRGQVDRSFSIAADGTVDLMDGDAPLSQASHQHKVLAELAIQVRRSLLDLSQSEKNSKIAKQLGLEHMDETEFANRLTHAKNLRSVFCDQSTTTTIYDTKDLMTVLYLAANGYLEDPPLPAKVFVANVLAKVAQHSALNTVDQQTPALSGNPHLEGLLKSIIDNVVAESRKKNH